MVKPFVQIFKTPNQHYLFEVNKNDFVKIDEESFLYLKNIFSDNPNQDMPTPQEIINLKEQGYLAEKSVVEKIEHPALKNMEIFLERKIQKITLQVTTACNFRCKYCIYSETNNKLQRSHSDKYMTWETAKKAIDFLWFHSVDSHKVNVGFYGGETLLAFPLIKQVVEYSKKQFAGKKLTFNVTTNGSLLTEEIIKFFSSNEITLLISLDGPKEVNDLNRVFSDGTGTFDVVVKNIDLIKNVDPEYLKKVSISMVIDPVNDFDCFNQIKISSENFEKIRLSPSIVNKENNETVEYSNDYVWKSVYQNFLVFLSYFKRFPKSEVSTIVENGLLKEIDDVSKITDSAKLYRIDSPSGPCIAGQTRLFINTDEELFPCERVNEMSEAMIIGTLDTGINMDKAKHLVDVAEITKDKCMNCWCFRYCTICAQKADDGTENLSADVKLKHCGQIEISTYLRLKKYLLLKDVSEFYQKQTRII